MTNCKQQAGINGSGGGVTGTNYKRKNDHDTDMKLSHNIRYENFRGGVNNNNNISNEFSNQHQRAMDGIP